MPVVRRTRGANGEHSLRIATVGATVAALVLSVMGTAPAYAADAVVPPDHFAITGDVRVGETIVVSADGWAPADVALSAIWFVDGVEVDDPAEAAKPLDLTLLPEWLDDEVEVEVTATAPGHDDSTVRLSGGLVAAGSWSLSTPRIDGPGYAGTQLTAVVADLPSGATPSYQWLLDGGVLSSATDATYIPSAAQVGGVLRVRVTATRGGYDDATSTSSAVTVKGAFTAPAVTIAGAVQVNSTVAAVTGEWTPAPTFAYEWALDGVSVGTAPSYTIPASAKGKSLTLTVTGSAPRYDSLSRTATAVVAAASLGTVPSPTIAGTVRVDSTVRAATGTWPAGAELSYSWKIGSKVVSTSSTYRPVAADRGGRLTLTVTGTRDGYDSQSKTSAGATVGYGAFTTVPKPAVSGSVRVGTKLTAKPGTYSPAATPSYSWKVNGVKVSSASTFTPTASQRGKKLTLTVTAVRSGYASKTQTTASTTIGSGSFTASPTPKVSGSAKVGSTLKVSTGSWSPSATLKYQWLRNGSTIKGATKTSYKLTKSDWRKKITVRVTASRSGYTTVKRTSASTATVTKSFSKTVSPKISGTTRVGSLLQAKTSSWSPKASFRYQWKRSGVSISGATGSTYRLTGSDYAKTITVTVTGRATAYTTASRTSKATTKIAGPAPVITKGGTYRVGTDISAGTYVANGAKEGCYWERRSTSGSSFDGIIANDFIGTKARVVVTISSSDRYFRADSECGSWTRLVKLGSPASSMGNGTHAVGIHVRPGLYRSNSASDGCYWAVLSGFGGELDDIIENDFTLDAPNYVRLYSSDKGFTSSRCGTWTRISD